MVSKTMFSNLNILFYQKVPKIKCKNIKHPKTISSLIKNHIYILNYRPTEIHPHVHLWSNLLYRFWMNYMITVGQSDIDRNSLGFCNIICGKSPLKSLDSSQCTLTSVEKWSLIHSGLSVLLAKFLAINVF